MEFIEADPLPIQCRSCGEQDCGECDDCGLRWLLAKEDRHRLDCIIAEKQRLWRLTWKQARNRRG